MRLQSEGAEGWNERPTRPDATERKNERQYEALNEHALGAEMQSGDDDQTVRATLVPYVYPRYEVPELRVKMSPTSPRSDQRHEPRH
jgi:hypothetical protein